MSSGTEGNTEGKQGGTDVEDDSSDILPFPLGRRPEITRVLQLLLQLSEPLPYFRCGDGNDRTAPEKPGEF